jgi:hypothetical protein
MSRLNVNMYVIMNDNMNADVRGTRERGGGDKRSLEDLRSVIVPPPPLSLTPH